MITRDELYAMADRDKSTVTKDRMVKAAAREVALRANLYPRKILEGRMKEDEAVAEISAMMAILDLLVTMRDTPSTVARSLITQQ